ncbi:MAG TPA: hypothetical protein VN549_00230, partial [Negativicutes bacterium]|nr:hypothetical protein [Negativicutes bacterium]
MAQKNFFHILLKYAKNGATIKTDRNNKAVNQSRNKGGYLMTVIDRRKLILDAAAQSFAQF